MVQNREDLLIELEKELEKYFEHKAHFFSFLTDDQSVKKMFVATVTKFAVMFLLHSISPSMNKEQMVEIIQSTMEEVTVHVKNIVSSIGNNILKADE